MRGDDGLGCARSDEERLKSGKLQRLYTAYSIVKASSDTSHTRAPTSTLSGYVTGALKRMYASAKTGPTLSPKCVGEGRRGREGGGRVDAHKSKGYMCGRKQRKAGLIVCETCCVKRDRGRWSSGRGGG